MDIFTQEVIGDEDCLYLNVFTTDTKPLKKRAVMVWIHGGGFFMGSGNASFYGPDHIIRKDVVLVTLNYRLGVLGKLLISWTYAHYTLMDRRSIFSRINICAYLYFNFPRFK